MSSAILTPLDFSSIYLAMVDFPVPEFAMSMNIFSFNKNAEACKQKVLLRAKFNIKMGPINKCISIFSMCKSIEFLLMR